MKPFRPSFLRAYQEGRLREVRISLESSLHACRLCPRNCGADRHAGKTGECRTGVMAMVSSVAPHFGEEAPLVGSNGSGTIFFTNCNLHCNFCQNFDISHLEAGEEVSAGQLAGMMLYLQQRGCHNINLVTPSHVVPQFVGALELAVEAGLRIPLVYNTSAYDKPETLRLLDGIVDIYMPDLKFLDGHIANVTCRAHDYPGVAKNAIREMHRQVGTLTFNAAGIANRGLLVRHLVMPGCLEDTKEVLDFIAREISPETYINIMPQYRPAGDLSETPEFNRPLYRDEYDGAMAYAAEVGLTNLL